MSEGARWGASSAQGAARFSAAHRLSHHGGTEDTEKAAGDEDGRMEDGRGILNAGGWPWQTDPQGSGSPECWLGARVFSRFGIS
jgi:hypothetical protein